MSAPSSPNWSAFRRDSRGLVYSKSKTTWIGTTVDKRSATIDGLDPEVSGAGGSPWGPRVGSAVLSPRPGHNRRPETPTGCGASVLKFPSHTDATSSDRCTAAASLSVQPTESGTLRLSNERLIQVTICARKIEVRAGSGLVPSCFGDSCSCPRGKPCRRSNGGVVRCARLRLTFVALGHVAHAHAA